MIGYMSFVIIVMLFDVSAHCKPWLANLHASSVHLLHNFECTVTVYR